MTREEAIQEFQNVKDLVKQDGKDWFDERDLELIDMAIKALSEPSGDVISLADAIETIMSEPMNEPKYPIWFADRIKALPSTYSVQGWIPCSERLPSEHKKYLVFYEGNIIGSNIEIMWYGEPLMPNVDVSGKHFYRSDSEWGDIIYDEVIAWMPLPEPYKGGDTE